MKSFINIGFSRMTTECNKAVHQMITIAAKDHISKYWNASHIMGELACPLLLHQNLVTRCLPSMNKLSVGSSPNVPKNLDIVSIHKSILNMSILDILSHTLSLAGPHKRTMVNSFRDDNGLELVGAFANPNLT